MLYRRKIEPSIAVAGNDQVRFNFTISVDTYVESPCSFQLYECQIMSKRHPSLKYPALIEMLEVVVAPNGVTDVFEVVARVRNTGDSTVILYFDPIKRNLWTNEPWALVTATYGANNKVVTENYHDMTFTTETLLYDTRL